MDLAAPHEARRLILHIISADFALEWARLLPPNVKYVGPLTPEPAERLPPELTVSTNCGAEVAHKSSFSI